MPLLVLLGVSVFGGGFDADAALRAAHVRADRPWSARRWPAWSAGRRRRYSLAGETIRLRTGLLSINEVEVPFARVQAIDVEQGPIQRLFGVR